MLHRKYGTPFADDVTPAAPCDPYPDTRLWNPPSAVDVRWQMEASIKMYREDTELGTVQIVGGAT